MLSSKTKPDFVDLEFAFYFSKMQCRKLRPMSRWRQLKITKFSTNKSILFVEVGYKTNAFIAASEKALQAYLKWEKEEAERILLGEKPS